MPCSARHGVMWCKSSCYAPRRSHVKLPELFLRAGVWSFHSFTPGPVWASVHVCVLACTVRPPAGAFSPDHLSFTAAPRLRKKKKKTQSLSLQMGNWQDSGKECWNAHQFQDLLALISTWEGRQNILTLSMKDEGSKHNKKKPFGVEHKCLDGPQHKRGGERSCMSLPPPLFLIPPQISLLEDNVLSPMLPKLVRPWRFPLARAAAVPIKPRSNVKKPGRDYRGHRHGRVPWVPYKANHDDACNTYCCYFLSM